jgi:regulator of protease activity HflC (stomatin/prohibitin superfamily)
MAVYGGTSGKVIDVGGNPLIKLIGAGLVVLIAIIFLFNSVIKVPTGSVTVLTLFGRVTGEVLPEGIHVINPLKSANDLSIQTQEIKESASVPSAEGLVLSLDTSLIYHLNPEKAADVYQKLG